MSRRTLLILGTLGSFLLLNACKSGESATAQRSTASPSAPAHTQSAPARSTGTTSSIPSSNGAGSAVLPAAFTANADGSLSPSTVAAPVGTTILLTITSKASHPLRVFFSTGRFLSVPAGGHGSL